MSKTFEKLIADIEPWFREGLIIKSSSIHEKGLFTKNAIKKGDIIIRLGGFFLKNEFRYTSSVIPSTSTSISEEIILTEIRGSQKDFSDYINHSCDPNAGFIDALTLVASRNIHQNEEVTIDYVYCESDESWILRYPCACKTPSCRRNIKGSDWSIPKLEDRFLIWASPFIKRRILKRYKK